MGNEQNANLSITLDWHGHIVGLPVCGEDDLWLGFI
jgi:hypothetical protein